MIFEAGIQEELAPHCTFSPLVSHVSRRWRNLALATPRLWTKTWCTKQDPDHFLPYSKMEKERFSAFLYRSMTMPIEIHLRYLGYEDVCDNSFVQLICEHIKHCAHLSIVDGDDDGLPTLLSLITGKPASLLRSVDLGVGDIYNISVLDCIPSPVDPNHLTAAILRSVYAPIFPSFSSNIQHLTSLRVVTSLLEAEEEDITSFQETLASLEKLTHLELGIDIPSKPPLMLPTLRFLQIIHNIRGIRATSVVTLSLCDVAVVSSFGEDLSTHFPSLQHLILSDILNNVPMFNELARSFPKIQRLTCHYSPLNDHPPCDAEHILDVLSASLWPKLKTIALSASDKSLNTAGLYKKNIFLTEKWASNLQADVAAEFTICGHRQ